MRRLAALVALAAGFAGPVSAQVLAIEIGRIGEVSPALQDAPEIPPEGDNLVGSSPQRPATFNHMGNAIDASFCKLFGFEFRAPNLPAPLRLGVIVQLDHPLWIRPDGQRGTRERFTNMLSSEWSYIGYGLEESWTMVPGTWTFTILTGDSVLAQQSFEVTVAPGQHFPDGGCGSPVS